MLKTVSTNKFLSTPSARRATSAGGWKGRHRDISIHALREEGDTARPASRSCAKNFYPRPPRGGRRSIWSWPGMWSNFYPRPPRGGRLAFALNDAKALRFLSTPSARRATKATQLYDHFSKISIHALREEGDDSF